MSQIVVVKTPQGVLAEEARKQWVGCVMHLAITTAQGLRDDPPFNIDGGVVGITDGFIVSREEALAALRKRHGKGVVIDLNSVLPRTKYFMFSKSSCISRREHRERKRKK